jgi:2-methylisocitrate lyase-like PEP mutase family enzyme
MEEYYHEYILKLKGRPIFLPEMVSTKHIFIPCVWDCFSTRATEISGFKAVSFFQR